MNGYYVSIAIPEKELHHTNNFVNTTRNKNKSTYTHKRKILAHAFVKIHDRAAIAKRTACDHPNWLLLYLQYVPGTFSYDCNKTNRRTLIMPTKDNPRAHHSQIQNLTLRDTYVRNSA